MLVLAGCRKDSISENLQGVYKGSFARTAGPLANPISSTVTVHFSETEFSGSSSIQSYPAICEGSFTATSSTINAQNRCYFTANFDWSYIFDGEYSYLKEGASLRIWRDYPDGTRDIYELQKIGK